MDLIATLQQNFLTPGILFFLLGILAGFFKSDLEIPNSISRYLSISLLMAIGLKGGAALAETHSISVQMLMLIGAGVGFSFLLPFLAFYLLRKTTKLDITTIAAVAAHYGSISMVTFVTASAFLRSAGVDYEGYIVAIVALMEAPAILSGLYLAHKYVPATRTHQNEEKKLSREIFTNGAILLLLGSFLIGWVSGSEGLQKVEGFFVTPFQGVLALFLLDMGLLVSKNLHLLKNFTPALVAFGIYMPCIGATLGALVAWILNIDVGTATLFIVLCASASYIAVPAAMRLTLPEAQASIYLPLSLAITFPFNVIIGIPLYFALAQSLI
jgi:uncharacterized protein